MKSYITHKISDNSVLTLDQEALLPGSEAALRSLMQEGESAHTRRSYQSALRYWLSWHEIRFGRAMSLPMAVATVVQFVLDHVGSRETDGSVRPLMPQAVRDALVQRGYGADAPRLNTVLHRLRVLAALHRLQGFENPCEQPAVRQLLQRTRRATARRGERPEPKPALTREPLETLLDTCDDSPRGVRDRALLLFAWASGGRRRSEVSSATLAQLQDVGSSQIGSQKSPRYIFRLGASKTNQGGRPNPQDLKPIAGRAATALSQWLGLLEAQGIREGAIFRRIRRGGVIAEALAAAAVRDIVKQRAELAGLGDIGYSAHSLRSGFVTEAAQQQIPLAETMALTGHRSVASVLGYYRAGEMFGPASRLAGDEPEEMI
jgi:integrase